MSEKNSAPVGVGVTTILMVLLVLTLSVFAALTLSSARADLARSRTNADTVSAWYAADAQASALYREFAAQPDSWELEERIPITPYQELYLHLLRGEDGGVEILAWQAVPTEQGLDLGEQGLGVWTGDGLPS